MIIETERLIIRQWQDGDRAAYASFVADPVVRRFYTGTMTAEQSDAAIDSYIAGYEQDGFGFWPAIRKIDGALIGDVGLAPVRMPLNGAPPAEIGWLLGQQFWGHGYAPEAARGVLAFAFEGFSLTEIVAFTATSNLPSQRVMQKIGMTRDQDGDFEHPLVPEGHKLRPHLLYRIANPNRL
ncbi:MAG: family N-acetyltransferase [Devosia sp.]|uniref:GNAT family N-acetyltransferase n=1 Tax=Devosia sp. TaxID=1871048 RepID=UPI002639F6B8|nr:GNAT family N-acetyltransferase [Devosia sp.]MDB5585392.1 family N-acetyltransferase [Devosia sp.]